MDISFLMNSESHYIDSMYQKYLEDVESVDPSWRDFFRGYEFAQKFSGGGAATTTAAPSDMAKELKVQLLIERYRERGHLESTTNPIRQRLDRDAGLQLTDFGLTEADLKEEFSVCQTLGAGVKTLDDAIKHLRAIYCETIGFEYRHITDRKQQEWLKQEIELNAKKVEFTLDKKKRILSKLNEATVFENFLGTKYIGQKRFSLEGGENTITACDALINQAAEMGVTEVVIGMAHRGRLNVLSNIMGKTYEYIFSEFEGIEHSREMTMGDGDVKYHLGFKSLLKTPTGKSVFVKLMPNPSHLEAVAPVVEGFARAKADIYHEGKNTNILPLIIHGDAAVAGQGVVYETAQMGKLPGYNTEGSIHFVINNQIGFTTNFDDARSSVYSTDVAKVTGAPVFHVNGDDAEAVVYVTELAVKFRQTFGVDAYIDMVCYRKHGHNESDEPKYTQPNFYEKIAKHKDPRSIYSQILIDRGSIEAELAKNMQKEFKKNLQARLDAVRENTATFEKQTPDEEWVNYRKSTPEDFNVSQPTGIQEHQLKTIHQALKTIPDHIKPIKKTIKLFEDRDQRFQKGNLDWACAELAAYGSLMLEGHDVRISGQDCIRGTFSHRHAGIFDQETAELHFPLNHMEGGQGKLQVYNSLLSEYAVMGFEYGYSLARPEALTIWEAQFGDFSNTAQTIMDQFISSAESKWNINSGIMLFLPHGYEGQGPEHSSAKPERYLQLCAEFNMIAANCTTPANFFHLIRRQIKFPFRLPTVVFTPKSLLRHPECVSDPKELLTGKFEEFLDDEYCDNSKVKRVLMCTGKVYYDLLERQKKEERKDIAIIRMEQLHPIPFERLDKCMEQYKGAEVVWVQEEPKNMGFWNYMLRKIDYYNPRVISRKSSASPATGYNSLHKREQQEIIDKSFE
jgi:2-oxoglutarate dehydrogenase E1 component